MGSTFSGIELGKRALQVQRKSLDVTGHNISNANTEGYSRQEAIHATNRPHTIQHGTGAGQVGTGVKIDEIKRVRDEFIDGQIREETSAQGKWEVKNDALEQIELIFNEPSDKSLRNSMDEFWNSLQELNNNPESEAVRATVRQRALSLTDTFNHLDDQLRDYRTSLNNQLKTKVNDINSYGQRIADLNAQISRIESMDQNPNDLRDKRDLLVEKLSKITSVQTNEMDNGAVTVNIEGQSLVWQDEVSKLKTVETASSDSKFDKTVEVRWDKTNEEVNFTNGEMQGLLEARDEEVPKYVEQLDNMAQELAATFNDQHHQGYGLSDTEMTELESNVQATPSDPLDGATGKFNVVVNGSVEDSVTVNSGDGLNTIANKIDGVAKVDSFTVDNNGDGAADTLKVHSSLSGTAIDLVNTSDTEAGAVNVVQKLGLKGTGAGRDFFTGKTSEVASGSTAGKADIVFVVDNTSSMDSIQEEVKDNLSNFIDTIKSKGVNDIQMGVIEYRDSNIIPKDFSGSNWTSDPDKVKATLANLDSSSGGSEEYAMQAVKDTINNYDFRSNEAGLQVKNAVLVTNEDADDEGQLSSTIDNANIEGLQVHGVYHEGTDIYGEDTSEFDNLTSSTGGESVDLSDSSWGSKLANVVGGAIGSAASSSEDNGEITAKNIDLAKAIKSEGGLAKIAAATKASDNADSNGVNDYAGDGGNALALSQVDNKKVFSSGTADFGDYYESNISKLGVDSQRAGRMVKNQEVLTKNLKQQRDSISGVSLDEEMSKMIKYQQSYTAAAKFTSTMDEILNTLVNGIKR